VQRLKKGLARKGSVIMRRKSSDGERKKVVAMQRKVVRAREAFKDADSSRREFFSDRSERCNREIFREACRRRSTYWKQWRKVVSSKRDLLTYKASLGVKEVSGFAEVGSEHRRSLTYDDMRRIAEETGNEALFTHPTLLTEGGEFHFNDLQRWLNPLV